MGNIVLLDDLTINKIAAGEVIERPASVVKELLENAIDAGASNINIEIQNGGIAKIRITDNGKGIEPDDMRIAFERHATSKIRVADDLETIHTMGFRGEALASIAAISKIEMVSRTASSEFGNKIVVEGGKVLKEEVTGCPVGTSITVENLFYNTPVRYKFLKKDYTEAGYIEDAVTRLALVNTNIAIKLINSGRTVLQTPGNSDLKSVIYNIYGKDIAEGILDVDYKYENIQIKGVVGKPEIARSSKTNQMFFVNKRYIKDKTLTAAADQAFKGMLPIGKFGFLILNIEIDPKKIDVNVHPAKLEIRFSEENVVFKAVMYAIKDGLLKRELITPSKPQIQEENVMPLLKEEPKDMMIEEKPKKNLLEMFRQVAKEETIVKEKVDNPIEDIFNQKQAEKNTKNMQEKPNLDFDILEQIRKMEASIQKIPSMEQTQVIPAVTQKEEVLEAIKETAKELEENSKEEKAEQEVPKVEEQLQEYQTTEVPTFKEDEKQFTGIKEEPEKIEKQLNQNFEEMYAKTFGDIPASMKPKEEKFDREIKYANDANISIFKQNEKYLNYKYIGTAFSTYIIIEVENEIYMIDQHAAHERIMYEKVKANFYSEKEKDSQLMLLPDIITLTHKEMSIAKENMDIFEKAGFIMEEFGDNTIKLSGVPNICMELDTRALFLDILDEIDTVARTERQEIEEKFIATVACKSAVKANMNLSRVEIEALLQKLLELQNPFTCPHGRPTAIKMTKVDIEKKFNRR